MDSKTVFKIVVLGEGRVGKTSLTLKYCLGEFNDAEESTINASFLEKTIQFDGDVKKLTVWDTAGQEKYNAMAPLYYRDADAAILVYDITIQESFRKVEKWMKELKEHADDNILIAVVGNKCDKENDRQIKEKDAVEFAKNQKCRHFQTSAKNGGGIEELFMYIAKEIYEKNNKKKSTGSNRRLKVAQKKNKEEGCSC